MGQPQRSRAGGGVPMKARGLLGIRIAGAVLGIAWFTTACNPTPQPVGQPEVGAPVGSGRSVGSDDGLAGKPVDEAVDEPATTLAPPPPGELDEFLIRIRGASGNSQQEAQDLMDQRFRRREQFISACMAEQGFTYIPNSLSPATITHTTGPLRGSREFAELAGFGITRPGLEGSTGFGISFNPDPASDPNRAAVEAMSQAERDAFHQALMGDFWQTPDGFVTFSGAHALEGEVDESFNPANWGCMGGAELAESPITPSEFAAIFAEVQRFPDSVPVHPQIIALDNEWTNCMSGFGFPGLLSPVQLDESLRIEWAAIQSPVGFSELINNWDWEINPEGPPGGSFDENGNFVPPGLGEARALFADREMALALADIDCRELLDFAARQTEIDLQLQHEFVTRFSNELEAWATWAETHRAN